MFFVGILATDLLSGIFSFESALFFLMANSSITHSLSMKLRMLIIFGSRLFSSNACYMNDLKVVTV